MMGTGGQTAATVDFSYADLDTMPVSARFAEKRRIVVRIPPRHVQACIDFLAMLRAVGRSGGGLHDRVKALAAGLATTCRITLFHPRIIALSHVVVTHDPAVRWEELPGGEFLFHFTAAGANPVACRCSVSTETTTHERGSNP